MEEREGFDANDDSRTHSHRSNHAENSSRSHRRNEEHTNLFVNNLPPDILDDNLRSMFQPFGTIVSCKVMMDYHNGSSKGFGFVKYEQHDQGKALCQCVLYFCLVS